MKKSFGAKTLLFPPPVWIIGSYDKDNKPNVMTASWTGICCSKPPCAYVSLRQATYTYHNITHSKAFTINVPSAKYVKECDYLGIKSGRDEDKFKATGLTAIKSELVNAPYVEEFPMVVECKLYKTVELGLHTQFIGEIVDVKINEDMLGEDGKPDMNKVNTFVYAPECMKYYKIGEYLNGAFKK